ncbi:AfsR/SARP family transcriptional regulator [Dactylosporangium matsuzakiense]|uniref:OmpR/PhoB-type domain-containing protein n=1 Tax=Dactylosporangium matsuzakiense TaxID=53360 RepID=A0A9W6NKZ6_9ACTN|nr:AfsR/SARP family transcriptional regulator [Dactylosporangium matsuzakiense]UWZ42475.1 AfsR/SARP family transcriptional regulator [Dactylosporangium matsuzakiense]GLL00611.1 hypothetical protein GCM10017581_023520 [Dactylosporangium matsuzakiense]
MSTLEYRILGPIEVRRDGEELPIDGAKQRTVLAALLLAGNHYLTDSTLSRYLWGEHPPATMNAQIYTYVSRLRKILGPGVDIKRRAPGYILRPGAHTFDLAQFERDSLLGSAALRAGRYEEAARRLRDALDLWREPALAGATEHLVDAEWVRLEEARVTALEGRIEAELALGRHVQSLPELTSLVRRYPMRERFRAQLMTTFYRCDRQADALGVYQEGRRILAEELGLDPGALLRQVYHSILVGAPDPLAVQ